MSTPQPTPSSFSRLLQQLIALPGFDATALFGKLLALVAHRLRQRPTGMYEVLDYEATLELKDDKGETARFSKRQRVRFLQDTIAYEDQAWGDGDIFADYQCSPGVAVDRYREGHRHRILISLRESIKRGEIEDFYIQRTIRQGFTRSVEELQTEIDHVTRRLQIIVIFPLKRPPIQVKLIEQNANRTIPLDSQQLQILPDGRWQARWESRRVRLYEDYIVQWSW